MQLYLTRAIFLQVWTLPIFYTCLFKVMMSTLFKSMPLKIEGTLLILIDCFYTPTMLPHCYLNCFWPKLYSLGKHLPLHKHLVSLVCLCICEHLSWLTCPAATLHPYIQTKPALQLTQPHIPLSKSGAARCSPHGGCVHTEVLVMEEQVFLVSSGHWKDAPVAPLLHSFL